MKNLILVLALVSLTSCSGVSKKQCADFDWTRKGQDEVEQNKDWQKNIKRYTKVCSKHGFSISKNYLKGVQDMGGALCTKFDDFSNEGWAGVGARDALDRPYPMPEAYIERCEPYSVSVDERKYNDGVRSVGGEACASFEKFNELGWSAVGARDAKTGGRNSVEGYVERCEKHYFTRVNQIEFNKGFQDGLKIFCTKKSGFDFGRNGGLYNETCGENEAIFLQGYQIGVEQRAAKKLELSLKSALTRSEEITNNISNLHVEIEHLNVSLADTLESYNKEKDDIDDRIKDYTKELNREDDPEIQEDLRGKLTDLREDAMELENKTLHDETETQKSIEEARFTISKLREERRRIDRDVPGIEIKFKEAQAKADRSIKTL